LCCRRILTYLVPLRILRGHLPSRDLLGRFPALDELYQPFITAIRKGDIQGFDAALDNSERRLVDLNVWLTLEKAREICIRGLFRRVYVGLAHLFWDLCD
jgi:COP9 signalosome complex subunit 12